MQYHSTRDNYRLRKHKAQVKTYSGHVKVSSDLTIGYFLGYESTIQPWKDGLLLLQSGVQNSQMRLAPRWRYVEHGSEGQFTAYLIQKIMQHLQARLQHPPNHTSHTALEPQATVLVVNLNPSYTLKSSGKSDNSSYCEAQHPNLILSGKGVLHFPSESKSKSIQEPLDDGCQVNNTMWFSRLSKF